MLFKSTLSGFLIRNREELLKMEIERSSLPSFFTPFCFSETEKNS